MNTDPSAGGIKGATATTLTTFTGRDVDPFDLQPEDIDIEDIIHALSNICRFTGHVKEFYSVAQHCVYVYDYVVITHPDIDDKTRKLALLHDAAETYLNDMARPVKQGFKNYREVEDRAMGIIARRFDLSGADWDVVKHADNVLVSTEGYHLMPGHDRWMNMPTPWDALDNFRCWDPPTARVLFRRALKREGLV